MVRRPMNDQIFAKSSRQNLTDLIVSCCLSMVKFRTGTQTMRRAFVLAAASITLRTERGVLDLHVSVHNQPSSD